MMFASSNLSLDQPHTLVTWINALITSNYINKSKGYTTMRGQFQEFLITWPAPSNVGLEHMFENHFCAISRTIWFDGPLNCRISCCKTTSNWWRLGSKNQDFLPWPWLAMACHDLSHGLKVFANASHPIAEDTARTNSPARRYWGTLRPQSHQATKKGATSSNYRSDMTLLFLPLHCWKAARGRECGV